jgi:Ni,Fe-hydrogenase III large subunit
LSRQTQKISVDIFTAQSGAIRQLSARADGQLAQVKIKDPSFHNWHGLALAVRENGISDFPLCNKSFDLSYAGHDL